MTPAPSVRPFDLRHVQLVRALFAAIAAVMITFSPDHSAAVGLSVFSGFAISTALVFGLAAWLVHGPGTRWPSILLGLLSIVAGMVGGIVGIRTTTLFFVVVIAWAFAAGLVETIAGARDRRALRRAGTTDPAAIAAARDALTIGILTLVLGAALLLVPTQYALQYSIAGAGSFTLTGITIGVGVFGGYTAIVAVYLAIAGFSPRRAAEAATAVDAPGEASVTEATDRSGGAA
ncbi:acyl-CoA synthetase [Microbacterium sp. CJ88]|uniref:acyl-CoA synthetase n=1 Tax=Microbacterium sp. CJ88 TaxID=3445672 RepID=UPI003F6567A3